MGLNKKGEKTKEGLPFVSIVVPARNEEKNLSACLESLLAQDYPKDRFEIIAVDNGSTDKTAQVIASYPVKCAHEPRPPVSNARNAGIRAAKGEIILSTDADCIADKELLKEIIKPFSDPLVGGVGGRILPFPPETPAQQYAEKARVLDQEAMFQPRTPIGLGFIQTANAAYRKKVLEEAGLFDGSLKRGADSDLAYRVQWANHSLAMAPEAKVFHRHRETWLGIFWQFFGYAESKVAIYKKHRNRTGISHFISLRKYGALALTLLLIPVRLVLGKTRAEKTYHLYSLARWLGQVLGTWSGTLKCRFLVL